MYPYCDMYLLKKSCCNILSLTALLRNHLCNVDGGALAATLTHDEGAVVPVEGLHAHLQLAVVSLKFTVCSDSWWMAPSV